MRNYLWDLYVWNVSFFLPESTLGPVFFLSLKNDFHRSLKPLSLICSKPPLRLSAQISASIRKRLKGDTRAWPNSSKPKRQWKLHIVFLHLCWKYIYAMLCLRFGKSFYQKTNSNCSSYAGETMAFEVPIDVCPSKVVGEWPWPFLKPNSEIFLKELGKNAMLAVFNKVKIWFPSFSPWFGWDNNTFCLKRISLSVDRCEFAMPMAPRWDCIFFTRGKIWPRFVNDWVWCWGKKWKRIYHSQLEFFWRFEDDHGWFSLPLHLMIRLDTRLSKNSTIHHLCIDKLLSSSTEQDHQEKRWTTTPLQS